MSRRVAFEELVGGITVGVKFAGGKMGVLFKGGKKLKGGVKLEGPVSLEGGTTGGGTTGGGTIGVLLAGVLLVGVLLVGGTTGVLFAGIVGLLGLWQSKLLT